MHEVKVPFETYLPDGIYNRADLSQGISKLDKSIREERAVHGVWGFVDEHRPAHHAVVIEGGKVVAVLSREDYLEVRPNQKSAFAQAWDERKASAALANASKPSVVAQAFEDAPQRVNPSPVVVKASEAEVVAPAAKEHWKVKQKREREEVQTGV